MTSACHAEWRLVVATGRCVTLGTCLKNDGTSLASRLVARHLIAKAVKKLP
jgi:hypothetical protein